MTRSNDEDPLARLRAADPATRAPAPDHARIRAAVDRRLTETGDGTGGEVPDRERARPAATADELAGRRRLRPLRYAAAAVGAVLLLGGGYTLGAGTGGLTARDTAGSGAGESQADSAGSVAEPAPEIGTAPQAEPGDADGSGQPGAQGTVFATGDLPAGPAQAQVYALELADGDAEEQAAQLAAALDLAGDARDADDTWVIGSEDGSSPVLRLHPDGTLEYADPGLQTWNCQAGQPQTDPHAPSSSPQEEGRSAAAECADVDVPAPPDAAETFAAFLTDAGLDPAQYEVDVDDSGPGAIVSATLVLGGQESDVHLTGTVVPDGIAAVWGNVATPTELGEYPLISPEEAVQRLMDPRFTHRADNSSGVVAVPDPRFSGPAPDPGSQVPWPVRQVQITTAELALVSTVTSTGVLVLPSYELTGTDAGGTESTWIVPALTEDDFDFTG